MRPLLALAALLVAFPAAAEEPAPVPEASPGPPASAGTAVTPTPSVTRTPVAAPAPRPIGTGGKSLADIARRQKELREREGKKPSLGVISNETLRKGSSAGEPPAGKSAAKAKVSPTPAPRSVAPVSEWRDAKGRTEADWKQIMAGVRERIAAADSRVKSLEADARKYENDFYAWSDGNYRERVIRPAWDQAREELGKARKELDAARTQLSDLEEDARKSGTPPGWLR
jgi:hypothetical protein